MMHSGYWSGLCLGLLLSGSAHGDLKVLFRFDNLGIHAHRVVETIGTGENYPGSVSVVPDVPLENMVMMKWLSADGQLLAVTQVSDPRIASSPQHMDPSSVSRVGLGEGAWVGDGPDGSDEVIVAFFENAALGLAAETWSVSLRQDK